MIMIIVLTKQTLECFLNGNFSWVNTYPSSYDVISLKHTFFYSFDLVNGK